jgi:Sec-independent protein translocase protein TatA
MEIALLAGAAIMLFGGNKIRDVARGLGAAKKEFTLGQAEADVAHERARAEARAMAEANATSAPPPTTTVPSGPVGPQN